MALKTVKTSGGDYSTLTAWEAGQQASLAAVETAECYTFEDLGGQCVLDGWTTSAANYIRIYTPTAERHTGVPSTGYRIRASSSDNGIATFEEYVRIEGIAFTPASGSSSQNMFYSEVYSTNDIRVSYCLFSGNGVGGYAMRLQSGQTALKGWNNIVYGCPGGCFLFNSDTKYFYNNTLVDNDTGLTSNSNVVAKNNIVKGGTTRFSGTFSAGSDYNATDHASQNTGGAHDRNSQTFTFTNAGASNYTITSSDTGAKDQGTSLSGDANLAVTDDIVGTARPQNSIYDIGAFEVVVSGGGGVTPTNRRSLLGVGT